MGTTPTFGIPELSQSQANPDITHNEALVKLQALLVGVLSLGDTVPPVSPAEGDSYVLGTTPTGAWAGRGHALAIYWGGSWRFVPGNDDSGTPIPMGPAQEGMRAWVKDENIQYIWYGSPQAWTSVAFITDGDKGDITVSGGGATLTIDNNTITDAKLRDSAALSVVGRAANSGGDPADIAAGANDRLLTRVSNALAFTQLTAGMVPNNTLTLASLANATQRAIIAASGAGAWAETAISANVLTMLGSADNAAIRSNIGAVNIAGDTMTGQLIINLASTTTPLIVRTNGGNNVNASRYANDAFGAVLALQHGRGTFASPTDVVNGDEGMRITGSCYAGGAFRTVGGFLFGTKAVTPSSTDMEGRWILSASPAGTVSDTEVLRASHAEGFVLKGVVVVDTNSLLRRRGFTIATLPTAVGIQGATAYVTDSLAVGAFGATLTAGGSTNAPVTSDGTVWRYG